MAQLKESHKLKRHKLHECRIYDTDVVLDCTRFSLIQFYCLYTVRGACTAKSVMWLLKLVQMEFGLSHR